MKDRLISRFICESEVQNFIVMVCGIFYPIFSSFRTLPCFDIFKCLRITAGLFTVNFVENFLGITKDGKVVCVHFLLITINLFARNILIWSNFEYVCRNRFDQYFQRTGPEDFLKMSKYNKLQRSVFLPCYQ
jgi:hypothetical protein